MVEAGDDAQRLVVARLAGRGNLGDQEMAGGARGDLRRMGHGQDLQTAREAGQTLTNGIGNGAADTGVDLVENQGRRRGLGRQCHFESQHEARQLTSRGDLRQGAERCAGVHGDQELDAVGAMGRGVAGVGLDAGDEPGPLEAQRAPRGHGLVEPAGSSVACEAEPRAAAS